MKRKYRNKKAVVNGMIFASRKEARRYAELCMLQAAGGISGLKTQVKFELVPSHYEEIPTGEFYKTGAKKGMPKTKRHCVEKSVNYIADFVYVEDGKTVVEDAKGVRTKEYIIKRKLMLFVHGIRIKEV